MRKASKTDYGYDSTFPKKLRDIMDSTKTTQAALAAVCGVERQSVAQWRDGNTRPDILSLEKIARYFNVSTDYLLGLTDYKTTDKATKELCATLGLSDYAIKILSDPQNGRLREVVNFLFDQHNKTVAFDKKIQEWPVGKEIPEELWSNLYNYASLLTNLSDFLSLCNSTNDLGITVTTDGDVFVTTEEQEYRIKHTVPIFNDFSKSVLLSGAEEKMQIINEILDDYSEMKFRENIREAKYGY